MWKRAVEFGQFCLIFLKNGHLVNAELRVAREEGSLAWHAVICYTVNGYKLPFFLQKIQFVAVLSILRGYAVIDAKELNCRCVDFPKLV